MNLLKKTLLAAAASTAFMGNALAAEKVAIVDVQAIFSKLPQVSVITQELNTEFATEQEKVKKLESDIRYNLAKLEREQATMSPEQVDELKKQVQDQRAEYEKLARPLEQNMRRRSQEEQNKLLALIRQTIDQVAAADGYDMVINKNAVVYGGDTPDISDKVADKVSKLKK